MMNPNYKRKIWMFPLFGAVFLLAGGFVVMLLWNAIVPAVLSVASPLTYLQAIGLLLLCKILFGGFRGRPHNGYRGGRFGDRMNMREKMSGMTEEERAKFKAEWRARCGRP